jgi:hypothetical protein
MYAVDLFMAIAYIRNPADWGRGKPIVGKQPHVASAKTTGDPAQRRAGTKRGPQRVRWGENGAGKGILMVKNQQEWEDSRKKLKKRKKRGTKDGRTSDGPAVFGFPMGGFEEQIERLLGAARRKRGGT